MTTIHDLDQINAEAMMTLSEIGFARYERFLSEQMETGKLGSMLRMTLKSFIIDWNHRETDLANRIKCAPMYKPMA